MKTTKLRTKRLSLLALTLLMFVAVFVSLMLGITSFSFSEVIDTLINKVTDTPDNSIQNTVLWNLRLPRIVLCLLVGAALSVCGATYQSIFRNPLTDPYILGISSGASLGAAISILLGFDTGLFGIGAIALLTALLTVLLIYKIASIGNRMHTSTLLLTGVCFTFLITAIINLIGKYLIKRARIA